MANNWYAHCAKCGKVKEKKNMRRLFYNIGQYGTPKILCFLCQACYCELLDELEICEK